MLDINIFGGKDGKKDISFPRYRQFVKSLYRDNLNCAIPVVQDADIQRVYPRMIAWQFPDLELLDWLYEYVEKSAEEGEASRGVCAHGNENGVDLEIKDSYDVPMRMHDYPIDQRNMSDFLLGTLTLDNWIKHCAMEYIMHNPMYRDKSLAIEDTLLQYQFYYPGGGFKTLHSERGFQTGNFTMQQRELVFMIYLNDIVDKDNNGGTHFVNHDLTLPCKKGLTCIFPAGPDFCHAGAVHESERKAIVTGWIVTDNK
jgi:hypothetical protein|tara:strand:+ start:5193 stop:5960 length:768 start_codon:yes stop_codon:yes gene_type:complete